MAILSGVLAPYSSYTSPLPALSRDGDTVAAAFGPFKVSNDAARSIAGSVSYDFAHATPMVLQGAKSGSYYDDFYERIHIKPSQISLGNLVSAQTRTFEVWNAYTTAKTLTSISESGTEGINLSQPVTTPYVYGPNLSLLYTISVTMNGPPNVDALYQFNFGAEHPTVNVTGSRVILFPFRANFADDLVEGLEWKTDVMRSYDGSEQRRALRTKPRRTINYSFNAVDSDAQMLASILVGWQQRVFAVPIWMDRVTTTSGVTSGGSFVPCVTDTYSFSAGGLAVMWGGSTSYEIVEIDTVAANGLNLKRPLENNWPIRTLVYPAAIGSLPSSVSLSRKTNTALTGTASFLMEVKANDPYLPTLAAPTTYGGIEVLTVQPNWAGDLDIESTFNLDTLDFAVGVTERDSGELLPFSMRKYSWLLKSRAEAKAFRGYLLRMRGRTKTCWVPTWTDDFTLSGNVDASHSYIRCTDNRFWLLVAPALAASGQQRHIMIRLRSGQTFYRRIVDALSDPLGQMIYLDSSLGVAVTPADVRAIHFIDLCRFATDKFDIRWKSDSTAVIDSTFQTVKA